MGIENDRYESPERLFGTPGAEHMHFDLAAAYESDIDPWVDDHDLRPTLIEEWSVCPSTSHLPSVDGLIDWVCERVADEGLLDEYGYEAFENSAKAEDVLAAFQAALDLWASKVTYRMADKLLRTHTITWDEQGEPLADGAPIYGKAAHSA